MKWESIKSAEQIKLSGVTVHLDYNDRSLKNVIIRDKDGNALRVMLESYSMTASVPAAPEMEKVWTLTGRSGGEVETRATTSTAAPEEDLIPF